MQIVSQSAPFSLTPFSVPISPTLLLPAPPQLKQIYAPRIAGLLPATIPSRVEVVFEEKPLTWEEKVAIFRQMPRLRTIEEMDAEIAPIAQRLLDHLNQWREIRMARTQRP